MSERMENKDSSNDESVQMERALLRVIVQHLPKTPDEEARVQALRESSKIGELLCKLGEEAPSEFWPGIDETERS